MCIIIDNSAGKRIKDFILENAVTKNPHGFAIYFLKTNKLIKTMDSKAALKHLQSNQPYVAHCRFKTKGDICPQNIHLFEEEDWLIAMNGTVSGFADDKKNDTLQLIEILKTIPKAKDKIDFLNKWEARFLMINRKTKKIIKTGKWYSKHGSNFSKDNIFDKPIKYNSNNYAGYNHYNNNNQHGQYNQHGHYNHYGDDYSDYDEALGIDTTKTYKSCLKQDWICVKGVMRINKTSKKKPTTTTDQNEIQRATNQIENNELQKAKKRNENKTTEKTKTNLSISKHTSSTTSTSIPIQSKQLIGIYGYLSTLKIPKNKQILTRKKFIEPAITSYKRKMVISPNGTPYMLKALSEKGFHVCLNIFELTKEDVKFIDTLVGEPYFMRRKTIWITGKTSNTDYRVELYVLNNEKAEKELDNQEYYEEFITGNT